jgi:hypothetical protein
LKVASAFVVWLDAAVVKVECVRKVTGGLISPEGAWLLAAAGEQRKG